MFRIVSLTVLLTISSRCLSLPVDADAPSDVAQAPISADFRDVDAEVINSPFNQEQKQALKDYWWKVSGVFAGDGVEEQINIDTEDVETIPFTPHQSSFCETGFDCVPWDICVDGFIALDGGPVLQLRTKPSNFNTLKCGQEGNICCGIPKEVLEAQERNVEGVSSSSNKGKSASYGEEPEKPAVVESGCEKPKHDCVPYFQCVDGVINTDGAGLLDLRVKPKSTCKSAEHLDQVTVCCLIPDEKVVPEPLKSCPNHQECVEKFLCSDGKVNTDGAGLLDLRTGQKKCPLSSGLEGVCCTPPSKSLLESCPEDSVCTLGSECQGQALDASNNFIDYVTPGQWSHCSYQSQEGVCCKLSARLVDVCPQESVCVTKDKCGGKALNTNNEFAHYSEGSSWISCSLETQEGICCIESEPELIIVPTCPQNSKCVIGEQCSSKALDTFNNFVDYSLSGSSWTHCKLENHNGVCCITDVQEPVIIETCPKDSSCVLGDQCSGQALDGSNNFIDYSASGSWTHCSLVEQKGVCCIASVPEPVLIEKCPDNSLCVISDQCAGQALDGSNNFVDYSSSGSWTHCSVGEQNGVCCIASIQEPITIDLCPENSLCLAGDQCKGQALDGLNNFVEYVPTGSWTHCSLGEQKGVCCIAAEPEPVSIETCPENSLCVAGDQCKGQALDGSNNFVEYIPFGSWTHCPLENQKGVCCVTEKPSPLVIDKCPTSSACVSPEQCSGKALDASNSFIDYSSTGSWSHCPLGELHGICCHVSGPERIDVCPESSVCVLGDQCSGTALDESKNFVDYSSSGSWSHCSLGQEEGICCKAPPSKIVDACPGESECILPKDCKGTFLNHLDKFVDYNEKETLTHCSTYDQGICCLRSGPDSVLQPAAECGIRNYKIDQRITISKYEVNEASFGEFPWQAIIFYKNYTFNCGATLISENYLLTAAHCVDDLVADDIRIRLGEWQVNSFDEPLPYLDRYVKSIHLHPKFNPSNVHNDIAILELFKPVNFQYHINSVCLPKPGQVFEPSTKCFVTGWGKDSFKGEFQHILKKVDLPYIDHETCETLLRKTRLGKYFKLNPSFMCAGGEENKDACYGDGGGPLVCKDQTTKRYVLVGLTSWGIGCGDKDVPGVYADVQFFSEWVRGITSVGEPLEQQQTEPVKGYGK